MRHAVILAGGSGERFWPLSRADRPKQFLPLAGTSSLLRATFERIRAVVPAERVWIVTSDRHARRVRKEIPEVPARQVLREPMGRNTAPALYLAALAISRVDPGASMLSVPADAWVPRKGPYQKSLREALKLGEAEDRLVLVGVSPTRAETGYGYIEPGPALSQGIGRAVKRFVEKPSLTRARRFVAGKRHLWNCGIFAWRTSVFVDEVHEHLPELVSAFEPLEGKHPTRKLLASAYRKAPSISVDHGVLERAGNVAVIPATFPWDDLGSWRALERLSPGDFRRGEVIALDSPGLVAWAESGMLAVVGVPDVVVVHTKDATLVVAKDRAQDVRKIVASLGKKKR
jgi:mannose-1-phosphate guanylyltransferase